MSTDFLFAEQSFIRGVGSIGNLNGEIIFNSSISDDEADNKALTSDWQEVGNDVRIAVSKYAENAQ